VLQSSWAIVTELAVRVLQCLAVCFGVLQCVAVAIVTELAVRVLQRVAVCCSEV